MTENGGITKKSTRVADRAFPEIKIPWRQPGDFSRSDGKQIAYVSMIHLPIDATDEDLIAFIDRWASMLEAEDYDAAYNFTSQEPQMQWTPTSLRDVIKAYGDAKPNQVVTLDGKSNEIKQRKFVERWGRDSLKIGEIWYDLNIDGSVSDLTAFFAILDRRVGLEIELNDIHLM